MQALLFFRQEEMYQLLISNYEEKQQELRVENNDLRDCLVDMQRELASILNNTEISLSNTTVIKVRDFSKEKKKRQNIKRRKQHIHFV